jgi:hypothetical protein
MALILVKEDGTGLPTSNAYADVADCDAYHEGHLYASAWTAASAGNKAAALVMATRLIDAESQFSGVRANATQSLQWPREDCPDPDANADAVGQRFVLADVVPKGVIEATCEMARELLIADRTASPPGEGLKYFNQTGSQTGYDKKDTRPVISRLAQAMLAKYGSLLRSTSGAVRLRRS